VITGHTALYGVMGHPVAHTFSPVMQNAAFAKLGVDAAYLALPVAPPDLEVAVRGALALGFAGLNVTVPHKERVVPLCVRLDKVATEVAAVNTLRRTSGGYEGFNTDAPACLALLEGAGADRPGAHALVLGAGGAARAAVWALARLRARVEVSARRPEASAALVRHFAQLGGSVASVSWSEAGERATAADLVVNATPVGLGRGDALGLPPVRWRRGHIAVDFVYGKTTFLEGAATAGAAVVRGEEILVRQGALAFSLWTGQPAPEAVMTAAIQPAITSPRGGP
jgi:shikimate dehydrogenase